MAFRKKKPKIKLIPDCKDFKPFFFDREHCKLTNKCGNAKHYEMHCFLKHPDLCTGIKQERYNEWLKEDMKND